MVDLSERRRERLGGGGLGSDGDVVFSVEGSLLVVVSVVFVVVGEDVDVEPMR